MWEAASVTTADSDAFSGELQISAVEFRTNALPPLVQGREKFLVLMQGGSWGYGVMPKRTRTTTGKWSLGKRPSR